MDVVQGQRYKGISAESECRESIGLAGVFDGVMEGTRRGKSLCVGGVMQGTGGSLWMK